MAEEFMTVAKIAELLKLNQQTVRNWIDQVSLPALHVGRRVRVRRSVFDRSLEQSYTAGSVREPAPATPSIWDGEVPPPVVP